MVCCSVLQCVAELNSPSAVSREALNVLGVFAVSYVISRTILELVRAILRAEVDVVSVQVGSFCNLSMCTSFFLRLLLPNSKRNLK